MAESYAEAVRFKAVQAFKTGEFEKAIEMFDELVTFNVHPYDKLWRAVTLQLLGRYAEACSAYELVLCENPEMPGALHHLALIKATCNDPSLRDGKFAVELATRACEISRWQDWVHVSVLAAAYAEVSDWKQAEHFALMALELAPADEKKRRQNRLDEFRQRKVYRSSPEIDRTVLVPPRDGRGRYPNLPVTEK